MATEGQQPEKWHLQKGVPVTIIAAIVAQTCGALWWAAKIDARMSMVEPAVAALQAEANANTQKDARLAILESKVTDVRSDVKEIRDLLQQYVTGKERVQP